MAKINPLAFGDFGAIQAMPEWGKHMAVFVQKHAKKVEFLYKNSTFLACPNKSLMILSIQFL